MKRLFAIGEPKLKDLSKKIMESTYPMGRDLEKSLRNLEFDTGWRLVQEELPFLENNKARNVIRVLFSDKIDQIKGKLQDRREIIRAIECLGYFPSREIVEIIVPYLGHPEEVIQLAAAEALSRHTPRLVVPCLVKGLKKKTVSPARAGEVLLKMGYLAEESLLMEYDSASQEVKGQIIEFMMMAENPKCQKIIRDALQSGDPGLVKNALEAVMVFSFEELWEEVVLCLSSKSWAIRAFALDVLERLGSNGAKEAVMLKLSDEDPYVRERAEKCLRALN